MKLIMMVILVSSTSLAQDRSGPFILVFLNPDPNRPVLPQATIDSLQDAHLRNIQKLSNEGKLIIAGPFDGGGGIFVLATASTDTARLWLSTDPAIHSKRWTIETFRYTPLIGSICRVVVQYEMTTYGFVRFQWKQGNPQSRLLQIAPRDSIVAAGMLEGSGSILVLKGTPDEGQLRKTKVVQEGMIDVIVRRLWIAKGSFCEQ